MISAGLQSLYAGNTTFRALETLQIYHPSWFGGSFWLVNDSVNWTFQLEGGGSQAFIAFPFELTLPQRDTSGNQELGITLCNIGKELMPWIEAAINNPVPIEVYLRIYIDITNSQPQNDPPLHLSISELSVTKETVTGTASRYDVVNSPFPSRIYTVREFPGLDR